MPGGHDPGYETIIIIDFGFALVRENAKRRQRALPLFGCAWRFDSSSRLSLVFFCVVSRVMSGTRKSCKRRELLARRLQTKIVLWFNVDEGAVIALSRSPQDLNRQAN